MIWFPFASLPFSHVAVAVGCTLIVGVVRDATVLVIADVAADVTASKWRFSVPDSADVTSRPLLACCQLEVLTARLPVENSESIRCLKMSHSEFARAFLTSLWNSDGVNSRKRS